MTEIKNEVVVTGCMDHTMDHTFESANRVYDPSGIAPTVNTCGGEVSSLKLWKRNVSKFVKLPQKVS